MEPVFGIRRDQPPDLDAVGEDEALVARIRAEIERDGPIPFARFMDLALYDPDGGYYRSTEARPGRAGDFLTAPEIHPIFGWALAGLLEDAWRRLGEPRPFVLRELGAGTGALALAILDRLERTASPLRDVLAYDPVEVEPGRLDTLAGRFVERGATDGLLATDRRGGTVTGIVLANEVLDALPVHRVRRRGDRLVEIAVGMKDGTFVDVEVEPSTPLLAARLADEQVELVDGQAAEICLAADRWVAETAAGLERGLLLLIDYGAPAAELYDPVRRREGTLMAYVRHRASHDPYAHVGRQDLTAHVDVTAVERAAVVAGLTHVATTTQAELLVGLGAEALLREVQEDPATSLEAYLDLRSSLMRLLDPAAMGRFRVMAFGRDWPDGPPLDGFAFRAPRRPPAERMPTD
jgi:SAM-dependent MidA family methyltransferase